MPYYDIYDMNDNLIASNVFIEDGCYNYGDGNGAGFVVASGVIGYILAFIGMVIMLFNVPSTFLFPAILAFLFFIIIPIVPVFLKKPIWSVVSVIVKNLYIFLNIFIGMWWILYSTNAVSEVLLIGILVITMYSMYIVPALLVYEGYVLDNEKFGITGAVISFIVPLIIYLFLHDSFKGEFSNFVPVIFSSLVTVVGTMFLLINKTIYFINNQSKRKNLISYIIYFTIIITVCLLSFVLIPINKENRYLNAQELILNSEYKEAREELLGLGRYKDSAAIYENIKYKKLEVGETIEFGCYFEKPDDFDTTGLFWTVISVEDGKALLLSNAIIDSFNSGNMEDYESTNLFYNLRTLYDCFSEEDKNRVISQRIEFTSNKGTKSYDQNVFILSQEELFECCTEKQIYSKKDTKYNDLVVLEWLRSNYDNEYDYSYYLRNTADTGEWLVVNCNEKRVQVRHQKYIGLRPAVVISIE